MSDDMRERLIEAAAKAVFDEWGPESTDDDRSEATAVAVLDAVLPLIADEIQSEADREQWAFAGDTYRFWEGVTAGKARAATMVRSWITS